MAARLDVVGVFGYSDEDGTEAADLAGKHSTRTRWPPGCARVGRARRGADRAARRGPGRRASSDVLVEDVDEDGDRRSGRAAHQGPEVDGVTRLARSMAVRRGPRPRRVVGSDGVDLVGGAR